MSTPNYQYQSDFALKFFTEGKAEGEASLLLHILERRGIAISEHDRDRVLSCTELAQIESWADRALTATTRDEVFES
ncbi:MAG: hypothetical protein IPK80_03990 [Nannocystis sp.]|nr:hypothetical protein [Nannocystis sp.]